MGIITELRVVLHYITSIFLFRPGSRCVGMASCQPRFPRQRSNGTEARKLWVVGTEELGKYDQVTGKHSCGCLTGPKRV